MNSEETKFFFQDIAYRRKDGDEKKLDIGVIMETGANRRSSCENKYVNIKWIPHNKQQLVHEKDLILYDRFLKKGDFVRRNGDVGEQGNTRQTSQFGLCIADHRTFYTRVLNRNKALYEIGFNELLPVTHLCVNDVILFRNWIGIIKNVEKDITLKTRDKSILEMKDKDVLPLETIYEPWGAGIFEPRNLYTHQVLIGHSELFANALKMKLTSDMKALLNEKKEHLIVQIIHIIENSVEVEWICNCGFAGIDTNVEPDAIIPKKNLIYIRKLNKYDLTGNYYGAYTHFRLRGYQETLVFNLCRMKVKVDGKWNWIAKLKPDDFISTVSNDMSNQALSIAEHPEVNFAQSDIMPLESTEEKNELTETQNENKRKLSVEEDEKESSKKQRCLWNMNEIRKHYPPSPLTMRSLQPVEVMLYKTSVNILWQDGTRDMDVDSRDLISVAHIDENEYFPGDFVNENSSTARDRNVYGCVETFNHIDRTALVSWARLVYTEINDVRTETFKEEECSVYSITKHAFSKFKRGTLVVRREKNFGHTLFANVGTVTGVQPYGRLWVHWMKGSEELMYPVQLYNVTSLMPLHKDGIFVPPKEENKLVLALMNIVQDPLTEISRIFQSVSSNARELLGAFEFCTHCKRFEALMYKCLKTFSDRFDAKWNKFLNDLRNANRQIAQVIYHTLCNSSIFGLKEMNDSKMKGLLNESDKNLQTMGEGIHELENIQKDLTETEKVPKSSFFKIRVSKKCHKLCRTFEQQMNNYGETQSSIRAFINDFKAQLRNMLLEEFESFPTEMLKPNSNIFKFIAHAPIDHRYYKHLVIHSLNIFKIMRKELIICETCLPSEIYIKGFKDRLDLFSVLVQGPQHTPYEDGLYLFDLQFPKNYPESPPKVSYISFCTKRFNPNIKAEGKVLLSLLGTLESKEEGKWDPNSSTLCKVLTSIRNLIFVAEPYYNKPDSEMLIGSNEGEENSRLYNEMVVIKTIESMIGLIERPAEVFKEEIHKHFKNVGPNLLKRYKNYLMLSGISEISNNLPNSGTFPLLPGSKGFCIALEMQLKKLEKAIDLIKV